MDKKLVSVGIAVLACVAVMAQEKKKEYPRPGKMSPDMTEFWEPQPAVVTPGNAMTAGAPSDAIVLFDGKDLSRWQASDGSAAKWNVHDGILTVDKKGGDIVTKESFHSFQLHLEWCNPAGMTGESQARGNSGVYMQGKYEIQILDNYENETYVQGMVGSVYKQTAPAVNAMRKPGEWNTYDIIYTAPVFKDERTYLYPPRVTVILNGVVVQNHTEIYGTTEYNGFPKVREHGDGPVILQAHGDPSEPISFRNIWIRRM